MIALIGILVAILGARGYFSKTRRETQNNAEPVAGHEAEEVSTNKLWSKNIGIYVGLFVVLVGIVWLWYSFGSLDIDKMVAEAESLQQQQKFGDAVEKWRSVAKIVEENDKNLAARAWFSVGYLAQLQGKFEEAIDAFNRSMDFKGDHANIYINRGSAKNSLGRYEAAIADLNKAIKLDQNNAEAYNNRGIAKNNLHEDEAAIADYNKAISLNPNLAEAYYNRGNTKRNLKQFEAALADYNEAIRLNPNLTEPYNNRGLTKIALQQFEAAIEDFNKVIGQKPNNPTTNFGLGIAKARLNRKDEARVDLTTALNLARKAGNQKLVALAEQELKKLDAQ